MSRLNSTLHEKAALLPRRHPVQQQLQFIPVVDDDGDRDQYNGGDKCRGHLFVVLPPSFLEIFYSLDNPL